MSVYTVYAPPPKRGQSAPDPERFVFVRDRFSFWAFLLAPLWMLRHRLWLAFIVYLIVIVAVELALGAIGASRSVMITAAVLLALLVGLEAATLRRRALTRRGWSNVGIVVGDDIEAAERRFFDSWVTQLPRNGKPRASSQPAADMPNLRRPPASEVTGLFPEPGAAP
jgi:Protein of unknown function (DUF2628)